MNIAHWPLTGVLLAAFLPAYAADSTVVYTKGGSNPAAMACVTCHGVEGEGMAAAGFPRLAGWLHEKATGRFRFWCTRQSRHAAYCCCPECRGSGHSHGDAG